MNRLVRAGLVTLLCWSFAIPGAAQVGADLNISPKRVVFEGATRSTTVYVYNRGTAPATYKIDLVDRGMTPDGQIRTVEELLKDVSGADTAARLKSAAAMVQFTPRRVTLAPGESQTVRLRLLRPAELGDGEYRTTLTVSTLPPEDIGLTAEQATKVGNGELSIKVVPLFGISIPVIVRQGTLVSSARIQNVALAGGILRFDIARSGSGSLFGDIEIHRRDAKGEVVGAMKGVGVYPEVDHRALQVNLSQPIKPGEKLVILYRDDDARAGSILASEALDAR